LAEAEVIIDAYKGFLSVKGDQIFVADILEKYNSIFENGPKLHPQAKQKSVEEENSAPKGKDNGILSDFANVFYVDGTNVSILINPPGSTTAAQARNVALLYLYAKYKIGEHSVLADAIKEQCKNHGCFDGKISQVK
jgi:hypothetical protein